MGATVEDLFHHALAVLHDPAYREANGWALRMEWPRIPLPGYGETGLRRYFRADAAFAKPNIYEYLEERRVFYAIRLPSNKVLQYEIAPLLIRPVGRPPKRPVVLYDDFWYRAGSWDRARRVVAKVEWHRGELFPRVGFIVTNMTAGPEGVVRFYNGRGTAEQWIKEGKYALNWPDGSGDGAAAKLAASAARGRDLAALLDTDTPVPGVTKACPGAPSGSALRPEIADVAVPSTTDGGNMAGDDFALTAGWGHFGQGDAVMPGQGRVVRERTASAPAPHPSKPPLARPPAP